MVWVKITNPPEEVGKDICDNPDGYGLCHYVSAYVMQQFRLDCAGSYVSGNSIHYKPDGSVFQSYPGSNQWDSIVPNSMIEWVETKACHSN
ncbi:hypothetical protein [Neisseria yangbaofengii]|uniref:hypothetical protein n=1 Tax=Neisseria yangbaofengii TaxID=2709396 RepID=UPI0013EC039B|nr:hypothetical protein [Neisseria yangbaofengii]